MILFDHTRRVARYLNPRDAAMEAWLLGIDPKRPGSVIMLWAQLERRGLNDHANLGRRMRGGFA